mmetsp:Transcript_10324/g.35634  ORF Transcript_10324/g.35634 Transcript_10324/m.35634 type:complete len:211 (-) Transcript_10324:641-1273(-)
MAFDRILSKVDRASAAVWPLDRIPFGMQSGSFDTWSRISASSGDTTRMGAGDSSTRAGTWYSRDLPWPVGITARVDSPRRILPMIPSCPSRKLQNPKTRVMSSLTSSVSWPRASASRISALGGSRVVVADAPPAEASLPSSNPTPPCGVAGAVGSTSPSNRASKGLNSSRAPPDRRPVLPLPPPPRGGCLPPRLTWQKLDVVIFFAFPLE